MNLFTRNAHEFGYAAFEGHPVTRLSFLIACICLASTAHADEFAKVKCGGDIPKAMIGAHSPNTTVMASEKKYRAIELKNLGGDEISDKLSTVNWMICGSEYIELIDRGGTVRDVMAYPAHSKAEPAFTSICQKGGKDLPDIFVGVLDASGTSDLLPVKQAWKIDQTRGKFVKVSEAGLSCPRSGIITADGGK